MRSQSVDLNSVTSQLSPIERKFASVIIKNVPTRARIVAMHIWLLIIITSCGIALSALPKT